MVYSSRKDPSALIDTVEKMLTAAEADAEAREREACAQIADEHFRNINKADYMEAYQSVMASKIRDAIRARSESKGD